MDTTELKTCSKCKSAKPTTEFNKNVSSRDGLCSSCKACSNLANAAWRAANPSKAKANSDKWRTANPEKIRDGNAKWRNANPEKARACVAKWKEVNPDREKECKAKWRAENLEALRIKNQNRRARKRENGGKLSNGLADKLFKLQRGKCACGCAQPLGTDFHMDHIMPLVLGGSNTDDNIQLLRQRCNNQKHSKHPVDFMQSRGFLL